MAAFAARLAAGDELEPEPYPEEAAQSLSRLGLEGAVLEGLELARLARLLAAARVVGGRLRRAAKQASELEFLVAPALPAELEMALDKALEADGSVKDGASRELARLRRELHEVREAIVAALERVLAAVDARHRADSGVTLRNGRYVVPIRREAKGRLGGIVHDESATQATLFVEPAETIEQGNRLREVEADEAREVQRILRELTVLLRPHVAGIAAALEMLIAADAAYARARCAAAWRAEPPRLADAGREPLRIVAGAHPLLLARGQDVVRFDLVMDDGERTVVVSGPNTGGKSVLLKAVGLAAALAQSGVLPAVGEGTVLPVFDALFADIGDQQSISESLSTFSAHLAHVRDVLDHAGPASLVLIDELGTGTDPDEGAALAASVLRALTRRGVTTIATTHLGALKDLAGAEPGIVNASLAFDAATLGPTYRFLKGVPGQSYALAIARRLGLDPAVVSEAEARIPEASRRLEATLAAAEARGQVLDALAKRLDEQSVELDMAQARLAKARRDVEEREAALEQAEKDLSRAKKTAARDYLLEARGEVEQALAIAREGRDREARRVLEVAIGGLAETGAQAHGRTGAQAHGRSGAPEDFGPSADPATLTPGQKVRIISLNVEGEVDSVRGTDVAVRVRGRRVRVRATDLATLVVVLCACAPARLSACL